VFVIYLYILVHLHHLSINFHSFLEALDEEVGNRAAFPFINIAAGKSATQSSTFRNFSASAAIDGNINTFSHTNDDNAWLEIDMGDVHPIKYAAIANRWCSDPSDPIGCLCRLSGVKLLLIDDSDSVVATKSIGNTCGLKEVTVQFDVKCTTSTQARDVYTSHQVTRGCLPLAKILKLQSTAGLAISVFEVRVYSPVTSARDRQSNNKLAIIERNETIHRIRNSNIASNITWEEQSAYNPTNVAYSTAPKVSVSTIKQIDAHNTSSYAKPSSKSRDSIQNVPSKSTGKGANQSNSAKLDLKSDVKGTRKQVHEQMGELSSGSSIDRLRNNRNIPPYADHNLTVSLTATRWEPVLLTEEMLNSGLRFFVFTFNHVAGLGSNLMNLFSQVLYLGETYNRTPIAFLGNYGYRRNATVGLLTGFFSPRFPVLDQEKQYALIQRYSGKEDNSTVWLTKAITYRRKIPEIYPRPEVFYEKMVHHSCPHLRFNDETKREMQKVRQDHGIDFDFGAPNITSVAFHIRRTDKEIETKPATAAVYVERLLKIFEGMDQIPNVHHCYVATDDVMSVAEVESELIQAGVSCTLHFLQTRVLDRNDRTNFANSIVLLTELSIMQEATYFVGTFTSNISDLVAVLRGCTHSDHTNFAHSYDVYGGDFRLF